MWEEAGIEGKRKKGEERKETDKEEDNHCSIESRLIFFL